MYMNCQASSEGPDDELKRPTLLEGLAGSVKDDVEVSDRDAHRCCTFVPVPILDEAQPQGLAALCFERFQIVPDRLFARDGGERSEDGGEEADLEDLVENLGHRWTLIRYWVNRIAINMQMSATP